MQIVIDSIQCDHTCVCTGMCTDTLVHIHSSTRELAAFEHSQLQAKALQSGVYSTSRRQMAIMVGELF